MSSPFYHQGNSAPYDRKDAPLPALPYNPRDSKPLPSPYVSEGPPSPYDEDNYTNYYEQDDHQYRQAQYNQNPFSDDAAIPLGTQQSRHDGSHYFGPTDRQEDFSRELPQRRPRKKRRKQPFFSWHTPWFIYIITLIQITVFIAEIVKAAVLTGSPIEIHPSFNPMIGPSPYVLINMGARYVPCMRSQNHVQNSESTIAWPCPNQTDSNPTCTLSELCGFSGVPNPQVGGSLTDGPAPDQWFRFIVPIFLHAGIIHIGFNMLLQTLLGGDMERAIGPLRLALVYFSSGIFGFVLGGNFAASGIASTGASGSIFGIIALTLLDILYTWQTRPKPLRDLLFIILDIVICFVLGLLPGLDNFSHIGGFLMGLVLGICLLRAPAPLRKRTGSLRGDDKAVLASGANGLGIASIDESGNPTRTFDVGQPGTNLPPRPRPTSSPPPNADNVFTTASSSRMFTSPRSFFSGRKPLWWAWWFLRAGALVGVIIAFIVLVRSFYNHHDTQCAACKYLSCLPVSNWCEIGDLTFHDQSS